MLILGIMSENLLQPTFPGPGEVPVDTPGVSVWGRDNILRVMQKRELPVDLRVATNLLDDICEGPCIVPGPYGDEVVIASQPIDGTDMVALLPDRMEPGRYPDVSPYGKMVSEAQFLARFLPFLRQNHPGSDNDTIEQVLMERNPMLRMLLESGTPPSPLENLGNRPE